MRTVDEMFDNYYFGEESLENLFKKKGKGKLKKLFKKVGEKIKSIAKNPGLVPLLPFKPAMKKALGKKGVKFSNDIEDIAQKFVAHIIQGRPVGSLESVIPLAVMELIPVVLNWFKELVDKKKNGTATVDEIALVDESEKILKSTIGDGSELGTDEENTPPPPPGNEKGEGQKILLIFGGVLLLFVIFKD